MSSIAGIIDIAGDNVSDAKIRIIEKTSSIFETDRTDAYLEGNIYFSCAHQYFTKEDVNDVSPIVSEKRDVVFNADIFLYNREKLIDMLSKEHDIDAQLLTTKGDAEIAFYMYEYYGISFVNILDGAYSIVIYDKRINILYLITDYVAARHLAYSISDGQIFYSTTLHVVSALFEDRLKLDEEWISAAYMDFAPDTEKIKGRSVYKDIFRVEPGHYIKIQIRHSEQKDNLIDIENIEYWNPLKTVKPLKLSSDDEYKKVFIETFKKSVLSMLRARNKHGILLSGGLDSSAVVSIAAAELAKNDSRIYSYTQVPCQEYKCDKSGIGVENETEDVLKNQKKYPNIECKFVESKDLTSFSEPLKYIRRFAQPVKPILNAPYIYAMDEEIKKDGISIVLSGGAGNSTISYGKITSFIYQKNRRLHFITSLKEASAFCRLYHVNRPKLLKYYLGERLKKRKKINLECYIRKDLKKKYNLVKMVNNHFKSMGGGTVDSEKEWKSFIFKPLAIQHMSYYSTCKSLFTGAIYLDPTMTKDIIELCISLPIDCFVKDGKERRAVRDYLRGIVSDDILNNLVLRGIQASDYQFRANKYWDQTKDILYQNIGTAELEKYFDKGKINDLIEKARKNEYNLDKTTIAISSVLSVLGCFFRNYKKMIEVDKWTKEEK